jgi:hypothetical protein
MDGACGGFEASISTLGGKALFVWPAARKRLVFTRRVPEVAPGCRSQSALLSGHQDPAVVFAILLFSRPCTKGDTG